jgi:xanthine dehydrogenase YagR molybdenum-binding subunit
MNVVGEPISRVDGRLKVTGGVRYTGDLSVPGMAQAALVYSTIASGRIKSVDTAAAEKAPGVRAVLTRETMPRMNSMPWSHLCPQGQTFLPLHNNLRGARHGDAIVASHACTADP